MRTPHGQEMSLSPETDCPYRLVRVSGSEDAAGPLLQRQRGGGGEVPAGAALQGAKLAKGPPERGVALGLGLGGLADREQPSGLVQEVTFVGGEARVAAALGGADGGRPRLFLALDGLDETAGGGAGGGERP